MYTVLWLTRKRRRKLYLGIGVDADGARPTNERCSLFVFICGTARVDKCHRKGVLLELQYLARAYPCWGKKAFRFDAKVSSHFFLKIVLDACGRNLLGRNLLSVLSGQSGFSFAPFLNCWHT